jgi:ubiquinone/menaquinone biosynthesis C-methylase UbiE
VNFVLHLRLFKIARSIFFMKKSSLHIESVLQYYRNGDKDFRYEKDWGYTNTAASAYWNMRDRLFWNTLSRYFNTIEKELNVLDVGCGYGHELAKLTLLGIPQNNLFGVDICSHRIFRAKSLYPSINFFENDVTNLPFEDNSFDVVFQFTCLMHIDSEDIQKQVCVEMQRVLKENGIVVWWDIAPPTKILEIFYGLSSFRNKIKSQGIDTPTSTQQASQVCFSPEKVKSLFPTLNVHESVLAGVDYRVWKFFFDRSSSVSNYLWNSKIFSHHCFAVFHKSSLS